MVARTRWTLRVDGLVTQLAIGSGRRPAPLPVEVSLELQALAEVAPDADAQRIDLEALCDWITDVWPATPPTTLLEARTAELMAHVFGFDRRVQQITVVLRRRVGAGAGARIAVEREATRAQFESQQRIVGTLRARGARVTAPDAA